MITIIHGDDTAASRKYFLQEKTSAKDPVTFYGETVSLEDIVQATQGKGLFTQTNSIFIEDFVSKRGKGKENETIVTFIQDAQKGNDFFFWESKEITPKNLSLFKNALIKTFKHPKPLFTFLDSITPGSGQKLITLFHQTLEYTDVEIIIHMMIRQFRLLLALSETGKEQIEEAVRLAPWQKGKLQRQAHMFSKEQLIKLYSKLYQIDLGQKTGTLSTTPIQAIDFFLLDI